MDVKHFAFFYILVTFLRFNAVYFSNVLLQKNVNTNVAQYSSLMVFFYII